MALSEEEKKVREKENKMYKEAVRLTRGDFSRVTASIKKVIPPSLPKEGKRCLWRLLRPKVEEKLREMQQKKDLKKEKNLVQRKPGRFPLTDEVMRDAEANERFHRSRLQEDW